MNKVKSKFKISVLVFCVFILIVPGVYAKKSQFKGEKFNSLRDTTQKMLLLNIDSVVTEYYDDTKVDPEIEFSDTFFVEAANKLFSFELNKVFPVTQIDTLDSLYSLSKYNGYSQLNKTGDKEKVSKKIKDIAAKYDVAFVLVPIKVYMKHITTKPQGWRDSPSYEKPVNYKAISKIVIQIWNREGELLLENKGFSDTGRPVLYKIVNRKKKKKGEESNKDIADFAKRFYSPPIVRALNKAIKKSLKF